MEKKEPKKTLLSEKIRKNITTEYVGKENDKEIVDLFSDNKKRLFNLLLDHPYFHEQVKKIRDLHDIPKGGFATKEEIYNWEHSVKNRKDNFNNDIDKLVSDFSFPLIYRQSMWFLFEDFITNSNISSRRNDYDIIKALPIFSIVETENDREVNKYLINPSSRYIEVFNWTRKKDVVRAFNKINENKNKSKSLFEISKIEGLSRKIWKMSQEGIKDAEILRKLNKSFEKNKERIMGHGDIPVYRRRYIKVLSSLRKIK